MSLNNASRWFSGLLPQNRGKKLIWQANDADAYAASGDNARSRNAYQNVIQNLEKKEERDSEETQLLGRVYLGLGHIEIIENNGDSAFQSFVKADACGYPLSDQALIALAEGFARENRRDEAFEYYIRYISSRKPSGGLAKKVYAHLESFCYVDEKSDRSYVDKALSLNLKVITANPEIDWAHYYLGMCYYLKSDFQNAEQCFEHAMKINPYWRSRQYYLGRAYLGQGNLNEALSMFHIAIVKEPGNADASFLIGKILIDQLETEECSNCEVS
jgi:tetratricopeptide (TPR) repeat protein